MIQSHSSVWKPRNLPPTLPMTSQWIAGRPIPLLPAARGRARSLVRRACSVAEPLSFADELLELSQVEEDVVLADEPVTDPCPSISTRSKGPFAPAANVRRGNFVRDD